MASRFETVSYHSAFANLNTQIFFCGICIELEHVAICLAGKYYSCAEEGLFMLLPNLCQKTWKVPLELNDFFFFSRQKTNRVGENTQFLI